MVPVPGLLPGEQGMHWHPQCVRRLRGQSAAARTTCIYATINAAGPGGTARIGGEVKLLYAAILLALTSVAFADDAKILASCPLQGDAKQAAARALNPLKRRMSVPMAREID